MASYRPESISMDDLELNSMAECEQMRNADPTLLQPISSRPPPLERKSTQLSYSSSSPLSPTPPMSPTSPTRHVKSPSRSSPFYWNLPPQVSAWEEKRTQTVQRMPKGPTKFWHGWKVIVFGSWLNLLLVIVPVSWILHNVKANSHLLDFIFCTLAMIPLVKMHDLATQDLALRIGGSKTGLLNASLSNTVELVIAIVALRKCELKVVQSSLIGSILSELLLVLGMCFFAGGLRFSEQDFNATATQIHSSLLSISVGALLLPAAYHFAITSGDEETAQQQHKNILNMSHGVSIVLLFIYAGYLVFQLWSHTHYYEDSRTASNKLSKTIKGRAAEKRPDTSDRETSATRKSPYINPSYATSSEVTLRSPDAESANKKFNNQQPFSSSEWPTINLAGNAGRGDDRMCHNLNGANSSTRTFSNNAEERQDSLQGTLETQSANPKELALQPELSWTMTLILLTAVTIMVSFNAAWLVDSLDTISTSISKEWIALILLPAVRCIAECATAVNVSVKDQLTLSVSVAVSSTIQTALFVIPFMVTLAWAMGKPLSLLFDPFESVVLYISVNVMSYVVADGKSNWLEGMILICLYMIIAVAFWFYPGSEFSVSLSECS
ncbi:hypothetical protein PILCRDRAFT_822575 [Piloderma croceum F 1598]|uniref:Sodium/calcium exchanger membrane region domain-containing protein n=1 Tax=Piloderma croceum (strain F 1598) TaxID=765440 RepID=A0A0C3BSY9_PILCF|nr:hypothetical protein PILCRDRAFT_822575 [Piloderma croceum F 1598]